MERCRVGYDKFGNLALSVLSLVLILCILFAGGEIGLSDNGDYARVLRACGMEHAETDKAFLYVSEYRMVFEGENNAEKLLHLLFRTKDAERYPSVHLAFVRVAAVLNVGLNKLTGAETTRFRLSVLGVLYALCYAGVLYVLFTQVQIKKNRLCDLALKGCLILVLCDAGYIAYFHSLYGEAVQILGFVLTAALAVRLLRAETFALRDMVYFTLAALLYGWSKFANLPAAALLIAGFGLVVFLRHRNARVWIPAGAGAACVLVIALLIPAWMTYETNYNAVFFGVLKDAPEEKQTAYLRDLGLPESMQALADSNYYVERVYASIADPEFQAAFRDVSKGDILWFYATHPGVLRQKTTTAIRHSGLIRPYYLSNYDSGSMRFRQTERFTLWSTLRVRAGYDTVFVAVLLPLLFAAAVLCLYGKGQLKIKTQRTAAALVIAGIGALLLFHLWMPFVSNGEGDLAKHMFAYVQVMDAMTLAVAAAVWVCLADASLRRGAWLGAVCVGILCAVPVSRAVRNAVYASEKHAGLEAGAYVRLGTADNAPIVWLVTGETEDGWLLLADASVDVRCFSTDGARGSNDWELSALREWLNTEFLAQSGIQPALLCTETRNEYVLSRNNEAKKAGGDRDYYATHVTLCADRGYDRAVYATVRDTVFLPDIRLISALAQRGYSVRSDTPYWLETPYFNNGEMVRIVETDGYIYFRDAAELCGVRPMLTLSARAVVTAGNGSRGNPFILEE